MLNDNTTCQRFKIMNGTDYLFYKHGSSFNALKLDITGLSIVIIFAIIPVATMHFSFIIDTICTPWVIIACRCTSPMLFTIINEGKYAFIAVLCRLLI